MLPDAMLYHLLEELFVRLQDSLLLLLEKNRLLNLIIASKLFKTEESTFQSLTFLGYEWESWSVKHAIEEWFR